MSADNGQVIDGMFVDRGSTRLQGYAHCWNISAQRQQAWDDAHVYAIQQTQQLISSLSKARGILILNNADISGVNARMFENYRYDDTWAANANGNANDLIALMQEENVRISEVHGEPGNYGTFVYNQTLASYLIGASKYMYYACTHGWTLQSGWDEMWENPDYHKALGEPVSDAVYNNTSKVYSREFKSGTKVWLDLQWNYPCIRWSDGSVTGNATDCSRYH